MKLILSKKEYRLLHEMIYLSDWMMNAHSIEHGNDNPTHAALRNKILSHYKDMQAEDIIEYSQEDDAYYETSNFEKYIHEKHIEKYNENHFWEELIDKLAERDVVKEIGEENYLALDGIDRVMRVEDAKEKYEIEFEQHGLEHLKINNEDIDN